MIDEQELFGRAMERKSYMMLDGLGINVNKTKSALLSYDIYEDSKRTYYGHNWITRLWCKRIRPVFFRSWQQEAEHNLKESAQWLESDFWADVRQQWETGQRR